MLYAHLQMSMVFIISETEFGIYGVSAVKVARDTDSESLYYFSKSLAFW